MVAIVVASLMAISMLSTLVSAGRWYGSELSAVSSISGSVDGYLGNVESICGCVLGASQ